MIDLNYNLAESFLQQNGYSNFAIKKIAGDASFRSYYRISFADKDLILMFAPPEFEDIRPFIKVDKFLRQNSFLAPEILAIDQENGFLLLQDFGDISYTKFLQKNIRSEVEIYKMATDELIKLHQIIPSKYIDLVEKYNNAVLFREVSLFIDWYLPLNNKKASLSQKQKFKHLWFEQFDRLHVDANYFVLRDYHADNLMLVDSDNEKKVGLLDFQDALIGSKAYDLVSLLEDARRDVDQQTVQEILTYYVAKTGCNKLSLYRDYEILSLQRNIKILGIFARLALRDNKKSYLDLLPRVLSHVKNRLKSSNSNLFDLQNFLQDFLI